MTPRETKIAEFRRRQPLEELERKASKARQLKGKLWTQEEIDLGKVEAERLLASISMIDD